MAYRKDWDDEVHGPFKAVVERALMLNVGESFQFEATSTSVKMTEQRVREYLRFMTKKDPSTNYSKMFIIRPLMGIGKVEIERRYPIGGIVVTMSEGLEGGE